MRARRVTFSTSVNVMPWVNPVNVLAKLSSSTSRSRSGMDS